jgi:hypothetical protein
MENWQLRTAFTHLADVKTVISIYVYLGRNIIFMLHSGDGLSLDCCGQEQHVSEVVVELGIAFF